MRSSILIRISVADSILGVRYIDIRCKVIRGELHGISCRLPQNSHIVLIKAVYHGSWNQGSTFQQALTALVEFLQSHPTETVILSVKDEVRHEDFSRLVWLDMAKYDGMWFLENRVPILGEVRGKAILLTRFWASKSHAQSHIYSLFIRPLCACD